MVELPIKPEQIALAKKLTSKINKTNSNGAKFGYNKQRILIGYLGEIIVADMLNIKIGENTFDYDLISDKDKRLEVKSVTCKDKPYLNYLATVNSHIDSETEVHKQQADYYIFTRILYDFSKAWIVGWISCEEFFKQGTFVPKGTDFGTFKFELANATVLEISQLKQFPKTFDKVNNF